jgi:hypothetical protein
MVMAANPEQKRQQAPRRRTGTEPDAARNEQIETADTTESRGTTQERAEGASRVRWAHLAVPVPVGVRVPAPHMPHLHVPSAAQNAAKRTAFGLGVVRANLPKPRQMVYYGALGGLAAVGAIEWPVAAAIGAGVWVASRTGWRRPGQPGEARQERPGQVTAKPGEAPGGTAQTAEDGTATEQPGLSTAKRTAAGRTTTRNR